VRVLSAGWKMAYFLTYRGGGLCFCLECEAFFCFVLFLVMRSTSHVRYIIPRDRIRSLHLCTAFFSKGGRNCGSAIILDKMVVT